MNSIRVLVIDDEKPARMRLYELLEKQSGVEIVGTGRDGVEAVQMIRNEKPDLLFLDVQMPTLDGFAVLREVTPERMPVTIFVTAYDIYAIRAFEAHALDYLLKPFSDERFESSLQRARSYIQNKMASELGLRLARLLPDPAEIIERAGTIERIAIKSNGRVTFLDVGEIDWIEAAGVYVYLHAGAKVYLHRATLGQIQERLDPKRFVRVHRSAAINTDRIKELQKRTHGDYQVVLKDGTALVLSRVYKAQFESWLRQTL